MTTHYVRSNRQLRAPVRRLLAATNAHLARYFSSLIGVEWDFSSEGADREVRCRVHSRSGYYRASARHRSAGAAVREIADTLVRQRRRKRRLLKTRRHR